MPPLALRRAAALLALVPVLGVADRAGAQSAMDLRPALSLAAGVSQFDLSGTGRTPVVAARGELPLWRTLLVEAGVAVSRPDQQVRARSTLVIPEIGLQAQLPRRVSPYLGAAVGVAVDRRSASDGGTTRDFTTSGAAGVRLWATERFGARGELRVRGIGTGFEGSTAEWTLGGVVRF